MTKRPTLKAFKERQMQDPEFRSEYDALEESFQLKRQMIAMRKAAGLTQEEMAVKLGTKASNISRLENIAAKHSPRIATVEDYARALGYVMKVDFEPIPPSDDLHP